jgi:hypothetical protein
VRRGLTTNNLVTPNFASKINPGAFADEAGPARREIHRSKAMSKTKQRYCWSGLLAIGALVLSARAAMVRAGSSATSNETYRATEVISYVLGSKQAVGYFLTVNRQCALTLMVAEAIDPDRDVPGSAARLRFALHPGEHAALAIEEGREMVLVCGAGAATMEVTHANARS